MRAVSFNFTEVPPSINELWAPKRGASGVTRSKVYRAWLLAAHWELVTQPFALPKDCYYSARVQIPGTCRKDIDNVGSKAIFDALVRARKTPDDSYLVKYSVEFHAGDNTVVWLYQEEVTLWAKIRRASKSTIRKLEKFSHSELNL